MLYTNPDIRDEAARKGTLAFEKWKEKHKDPRFAAQVARKTRFVRGTEGNPFSPEQQQWANRHRRDPPPDAGPDIHRDWSNVLGGASGVGTAGMFPAKYNFNKSTDTPSCASDFVVYTTATAGQTGSGVLATRNGTFTAGTPTNGQTATITNGTRVLTLTASTTLNTGTNFQVSSNTTTNATNLRDAINRNGGTVGVTATSSGAVVTVTAITHGTGGNSIALAETITGTIFAWAGTTLAGGSGTAGQPTIVAFNKLYEGTSLCGGATGPTPATYWSYNTGIGAVTRTSPVLSYDDNGAQVAFVQSNSSNQAQLVLLKWSSTVSVGTVGAPTVPASAATAADYRNGTGLCASSVPCMFIITFSGNPNDTNSSPYVDYTSDTLYVGADNGTLHKFTGVFKGAPAEAGSPWPVTVSNGTTNGGLILSSPVYDSNGSGLIFVGNNSSATAGGGGRLHSVTTNGNTVVHGAAIAAVGATVTGVHDAPTVDSAQGRVYAFVGADVAAADGTNCSATPCMAVYQFTTALTGGTSRQVGRGTTTGVLYGGAFDNKYFIGSTTGYLYVCGGVSGQASRVRLWQIPITTATNAMGTQVSSGNLTNATAGNSCSPVTEVLNGSVDYIYVSVNANGSVTPTNGTCAGSATVGCVYVYDITASTFGTAVAGIAATGGASGIIMDNTGAVASGFSQIYYSTLASPGNAVQVSQALLN